MAGNAADLSNGLKWHCTKRDSRIGAPRLARNTRLSPRPPWSFEICSRSRVATYAWSLTMWRLRDRMESANCHPLFRHSSVREMLTVPWSRSRSFQVSARYSLGRRFRYFRALVSGSSAVVYAHQLGAAASSDDLTDFSCRGEHLHRGAAHQWHTAQL